VVRGRAALAGARSAGRGPRHTRAVVRRRSLRRMRLAVHQPPPGCGDDWAILPRELPAASAGDKAAAPRPPRTVGEIPRPALPRTPLAAVAWRRPAARFRLRRRLIPRPHA